MKIEQNKVVEFAYELEVDGLMMCAKINLAFGKETQTKNKSTLKNKQ